MMDRKRVNASTIRSVGYDAGSETLEVEFTSGSIVAIQIRKRKTEER